MYRDVKRLQLCRIFSNEYRLAATSRRGKRFGSRLPERGVGFGSNLRMPRRLRDVTSGIVYHGLNRAVGRMNLSKQPPKKRLATPFLLQPRFRTQLIKNLDPAGERRTEKRVVKWGRGDWGNATLACMPLAV